MKSDPGSVTLLANVASGRSGEAATARLEQMTSGLPMTVRAVEGADLAEEVRRLMAEAPDRIAIAGG